MKKTAFAVFLLLFYTVSLKADATSLQVFNTGYQGQYIQASTLNNPVAHFKISADSAGDTLTYIAVENYLDSWYIGAAEENSSVSDNGIRVWYYPVDSSVFSPVSAQYVTHLPVDGSNWWHNTFSLPVADGSGIWITADIEEYPLGGTCEFQFQDIQFESGAVIDSYGLPSAPPVMMITQAKPVEELEISHSGGSMQPFISTSQSGITAGEIHFYNNSDSGSAPAVVSSVTLTVKSYTPYGTILSPTSVMASIKLQDKNHGTIYGQLSGALLPSAASPFAVPLSLLNVPAGVTTTVSIIISCADSDSAAGQNFVISLNDSGSVKAYDYYSTLPVSVSESPSDPTGFPMDSNFSQIQKAPQSVGFSLNDLIPSNINKGQQNVVLASVIFSNPGDSLTASAEIYNLTFNFTDSSGSPVSPASLFSKVSVTDPTGTLIYGMKSGSSIENTGSSVNFPLTGIITVPSGSSVTATVRADINPLTSATGFRAGITASSSVLSRDRNSFSSVPSVFSGSLPAYTSLALLTSSCVLSAVPQMPGVIYKGSASVPLMELSFSAPLSFGGGNLLISGITLTCRSDSGGQVDFNSVFSSVSASYGASSQILASLPASDTMYFAFSNPVTITASSPVFSFSASVKENTSAKSVSVQILSQAGISRFQDNDPSREIFIAPAPGTAFPVSSGSGYLGGAATGLALSAYPNPFRTGSFAVISYYLSEQSTVSIDIYDIMGNLIKPLLQDAQRAAGSRTEDIWDGTDSRGRPVNSGTYVVKVTTAGGNMTKKITYIR